MQKLLYSFNDIFHCFGLFSHHHIDESKVLQHHDGNQSELVVNGKLCGLFARAIGVVNRPTTVSSGSQTA
jgi:hypothetical protein